MDFPGFTQTDFNVFSIPGLDSRMEALKTSIRPKLESLGSYFSEELSVLTGEEMFPHVAKHARRTVNPPNDTWVAFSNNKRGYKQHPHFQIGLWESHLFIWYAVIYEAPNKAAVGASLADNLSYIRKNIPGDFVWSVDHTKPDAVKMKELSDDQLIHWFERLQSVKKSEILCGCHLPREEAVQLSGADLINLFQDVFVKLVPIYQMS
ncbi:YktB family protein [Bacillus thermotolerans]|uniref:YktB family protein n=1 Tax=Bacillus thermotolerans TaxID=1221996 RepID=UPI000588EFEC|nr:DUF1054 domain-containing protein [Bacillus thermotolerans]KKB41959.1 hypothetical protein QY96_01754 [Bacillus thermotolerans]